VCRVNPNKTRSPYTEQSVWTNHASVVGLIGECDFHACRAAKIKTENERRLAL